MSHTEGLLLDLVPVIEDLVDTCDTLKRLRLDAARTREQAHELVVRSRRQRLGLHIVKAVTGPDVPWCAIEP